MIHTLLPLTPAELSDLKAKAKAATPGPWHADKYHVYIWGPDGEMVADNPDHVQREAIIRARGVGARLPIKDNMDHIAAANPETILRLIAMVERRDVQIEKLRVELETWISGCDVCDGTGQITDHGSASDPVDREVPCYQCNGARELLAATEPTK